MFLREFLPQSGYKDTARMCVEAALALVDLPKSQRAGGVYSPAAACTLSVQSKSKYHSVLKEGMFKSFQGG